MTQIPVKNEFGSVVRRIDMGYLRWMVGVEYDGEQHFTNPSDYANDSACLEVDRVRTTLARAGAT